MANLDSIQKKIQPELDRMNAIIRSSLATDHPLMDSIVKRYLQVKGKQIRPLLVILSAKLFGEVNDDALHAGAALEMLHNATLIHDDVVDESKLRRGRPTINAAWDNRIAVLVGDFFVSNALQAAIVTGKTSIISVLSSLGKELSLGEIDQISNVKSHSLDERSYFEMIRQKTASLFMGCVRMGADAAGAPEEQVEILERYAELLGLCFQIRDDVFDYFPNDKIGKPSGNDLREGKVTLPLLHALAVAPDADGAPMKELLMKECLESDEIARLVDFAIAHGGIDYAFGRMRALEAEAGRLLASLPQSEWTAAFAQIFSFIISREK